MKASLELRSSSPTRSPRVEQTTKMTEALVSVLPSVKGSLAYESVEQAFPEVDPLFDPFGSLVLVQMRTPMTRTKSGFYLAEDTRENEKWNTQVGKVIALGPAAFKNRETLEEWPEKAWAAVGDFVRVPKYGGDRWEQPVPNSSDRALFILFNDLDLRGRIRSNPLEYMAYIPSEPG